MAAGSFPDAVSELLRVGFPEHGDKGHDKAVRLTTFCGLPGTLEPQGDEKVLPRLCP
jgi:hypothetical protein